ncbi:flavin reductase family protein [Chloroflexota bacterium]
MDKTALYKIGYGLYIVASHRGEKLNGQIANTVFQITAEPPTLAVSVNRDNLTWEYINESKVFSVTALCEAAPMEFIGRFGFHTGRVTDKFQGINYRIGTSGAPVVLDHAVAVFEAKVTNFVDVGTHTVFIGEVVNADIVSHETCMTYEHYHLIKGGKTPKNAATYIGDTPKTA